MAHATESSETALRQALSANGQRYTEQRAAVFRFLRQTTIHPTADEVFQHVRSDVPGISLATVYKNLEALVGCGLATKLAYVDGPARYDGRTDPHHHVRCLACGRVSDVPGSLPMGDVGSMPARTRGFRVTGFRLELTGYCEACDGKHEARVTA